MTIGRQAQHHQASAQFEIITRVTAKGGARVVVKITKEAIESRGRAACIAMTAAKIRAYVGKLPEEIIVSASDFQ